MLNFNFYRALYTLTASKFQNGTHFIFDLSLVLLAKNQFFSPQPSVKTFAMEIPMLATPKLKLLLESLTVINSFLSFLTVTKQKLVNEAHNFLVGRNKESQSLEPLLKTPKFFSLTKQHRRWIQHQKNEFKTHWKRLAKVELLSLCLTVFPL
jgi:16S rRNA A1518/A1519 N6-dimethyltransferase RsmA/KsgA/DIM1 with predicted DNA glycosylase/AP lyase activity